MLERQSLRVRLAAGRSTGEGRAAEDTGLLPSAAEVETLVRARGERASSRPAMRTARALSRLLIAQGPCMER